MVKKSYVDPRGYAPPRFDHPPMWNVPVLDGFERIGIASANAKMVVPRFDYSPMFNIARWIVETKKWHPSPQPGDYRPCRCRR